MATTDGSVPGSARQSARDAYYRYPWFARWHATRYPALDFAGAAALVVFGIVIAASRHDTAGLLAIPIEMAVAAPLVFYGIWNLRHREVAQQVVTARQQWRTTALRRHPVQAVLFFPIAVGLGVGLRNNDHTHHSGAGSDLVVGVIGWAVATVVVVIAAERARRSSMPR
jgi:hypothetical protein